MQRLDMTCSTAQIMRAGFISEMPQKPLKIEITLDAELQTLIMNLNAWHAQRIPLPVYEDKENNETTFSVSLTELERIFTLLSELSEDRSEWSRLKKEEKLAIEQYKLLIMQAVEKNLHERFKIERKQREEQQAQPKKSYWRYALFGLLVAVEIVPACFGCFLGVNQLLSLLPGIDNAFMQALSAGATLLEAFTYYATMKPFRRYVGLKPPQAHDAMVHAYETRLNTMDEINNNLVVNRRNVDKLGADYSHYTGLLRCFNRDMANTKMDHYEETHKKTALRWALNSINTALNLAGTYFLSHAVLALLAASLLGTPAGWAIISVVVVANITARFIFRQDSVYALVNPKAAKREALQNRINNFHDQTDSIDYTQTCLQRPVIQAANETCPSFDVAPVQSPLVAEAKTSSQMPLPIARP